MAAAAGGRHELCRRHAAAAPAFHANQLTPALIALGSSVITAMAYMQVRKMGLAGEPENRVVFYFTVMNLLAGIVGVFITGGSDGRYGIRSPAGAAACCCWRLASAPPARRSP
jgi:hypothetical protein